MSLDRLFGSTLCIGTRRSELNGADWVHVAVQRCLDKLSTFRRQCEHKDAADIGTMSVDVPEDRGKRERIVGHVHFIQRNGKKFALVVSM